MLNMVPYFPYVFQAVFTYESHSWVQNLFVSMWECNIYVCMFATQLGRPDFATCKIQWKHIAQCLNLASHFASSKTLIFNKGFACTNVHWNLYIVFIAIHYVFHCILPCAEHVQYLKSGHMQNIWFYFEFCSQHLPSCYTWKMTNGFCIM